MVMEKFVEVADPKLVWLEPILDEFAHLVADYSRRVEYEDESPDAAYACTERSLVALLGAAAWRQGSPALTELPIEKTELHIEGAEDRT